MDRAVELPTPRSECPWGATHRRDAVNTDKDPTYRHAGICNLIFASDPLVLQVGVRT